MEKGEAEEKKRPIFRDIRRYYCEYCGICRSKKTLIASHILAQHKDEMERDEGDEEVEVEKCNTCEECGASFNKPAYLKQHMISHSLEFWYVLASIEDRVFAGINLFKLTIPFGWREALDPTKELQNARGYRLEWTSTRGETSCEAPSSDPQSRSVAIKVCSCVLSKLWLSVCDFLLSVYFFNELSVLIATIEDVNFAGIRTSEKYCVDGVKHWIPNKELQNARGFSLSGLVPGGRPPVKLHQVTLNHTRPYVCTIDDCRSAYRRKDHLNRHLLQHQGKLFKCPIENCKSEFAFQGNVKRHVVELHSENCPSISVEGQKQHVCQEPGCGKVFQFASKLWKHEDSHVKLDSVEAFCSEPDCMKYFSNKQCLQDHIQSCHTHITCEICGNKEWKKNIRTHLHAHEEGVSSLEIKCEYEGCLHTFTKKSNLLQHVKAVHLQQKPFSCSFSGCSKTFSYKHVRDKHEKSGCHVYAYGDFEEADEQFRSRPRGGRKRMCPTVEMLVRKRVTPPDQFGPETEFLSQFFSQEVDEQ